MKHHILAIGISKHQISSANLNYAQKDALEVYNLFIENMPDIGYHKLLIDSEASLAQIRTALGKELQESVSPDDAFFFYYSGHGLMWEDPENPNIATHYLVPFDATTDFCSTCIPVSYIQEALNKISSRIKLVFIDSCFSGSMNKITKGFPTLRKKDFTNTKTFTNTVLGSGSVTITACKDDEEAIEDPELKNGLFTYYLLEELKRERSTDKYPVLDIYSPICENVGKRAKEKYHHTQTPTLKGELEGNLLLPKFRSIPQVKPPFLDIPRHIELSSHPFPAPVFVADDKELEGRINEIIQLVTKTFDLGNNPMQDLMFQKFCVKMIRHIEEKYDSVFFVPRVHEEYIRNSVVMIEAESYQFIVLGAAIAAFGSEKQMKIYGENTAKLLRMTKGRSGSIALISIPEIIVAIIIYVVGAVSLARNRINLWHELIKTKVFDIYSDEAKELFLQKKIYYCDALGGKSTSVNDHIRDLMKNYSWLTDLAPELDGATDDYQLQINLLLALLFYQNGDTLWPDFGRWYAYRLKSLVNKIKYDNGFRKQIALIFNIPDDQVCSTFNKLLTSIRENGLGSGYIWESLIGSEFLVNEE